MLSRARPKRDNPGRCTTPGLDLTRPVVCLSGVGRCEDAEMPGGAVTALGAARRIAGGAEVRRVGISGAT